MNSLDRIFKYGDLNPYFQIAEAHATLSPCTRRHYAAMICYDNIDADPLWVVETNSRQSRCCDSHCVRETFKFPNGQRVEVGAEVHAETAALISAKNRGAAFILVGETGSGSPLYGENVYPCHTCILNIKFAGYKHIYIRKDKDTVVAVSVAEIIEYREQEWEPDN